MEPLIAFIINFSIGYFGLHLAFKLYVNYQTKKLQEKAKEVLLDQAPVMYTEKDGNTLYLYDKKTNVFQCQAATIEDLAKEYSSKAIFIVKVLHDNKELWFVEGDILNEIIIETEE
jgi:hypothetical protein